MNTEFEQLGQEKLFGWSVGEDLGGDSLQSPDGLLSYVGIGIGKGLSEQRHCFLSRILRPVKASENAPTARRGSARERVGKSWQKQLAWEGGFAQRLSGSVTEIFVLTDQTLDDFWQQEDCRICVEQSKRLNDGKSLFVRTFVEDFLQTCSGLRRKANEDVDAAVVALTVRESQSQFCKIGDGGPRCPAEHTKNYLGALATRRVKTSAFSFRVWWVFLLKPTKQGGNCVCANASDRGLQWRLRHRSFVDCDNHPTVRINLFRPVGERTALELWLTIGSRRHHGGNPKYDDKRSPLSHSKLMMEALGCEASRNSSSTRREVQV